MQKGLGVIGVLIVLGVLGVISGGGYYYYHQNTQQIKEPEVKILNKQETVTLTPTPSPPPIVTPKIEVSIKPQDVQSLNIKITGEKLYKVLPNGKTEPLKDFYDSEVHDVTDLRINYSPDKQKIDLTGQGGITPRILYWTPVGGSKLIRVGDYEEYKWSPNSRYIAFTDRGGDCGPIRYIKIYDTANSKNLDISKHLIVPNLEYEMLAYGSFEWDTDSKFVKVEYTAMSEQSCHADVINTGELLIPVD